MREKLKVPDRFVKRSRGCAIWVDKVRGALKYRLMQRSTPWMAKKLKYLSTVTVSKNFAKRMTCCF